MKHEQSGTNDRSRSSRLSRRQLLGGSSTLAAAALLGGAVHATPRAFIRRGGGSGRAVYVQVFLRGGMDGLTMLVPHGDDAYYAARPNLAVPPPGASDGALDLDGFFGLAPATAPLLAPYQAGHLAFVHAAGSTDPTRSHFDGFARMEFGAPNLPPGSVSDGWFARYLHQTAGPASGELRAVAAGDIPPLTLAGAPRSLPIPDFASFLFPGRASTAAQRVDHLTRTYAAAGAPLGPAALDTFASIELMASIDFAGYVPANGAVYPATELGRHLRDAAALIKADVGVEGITIDLGGWDLHAALGPLDGAMAQLLDELARAIEAFHRDVLAVIDRVVLVCLSEFGRRVAENSSLGTDHGHGNAMILLGGGIAGGQVFADWPGLAPGELDDGDLAVTIDYRDVLGEILARRLGATDLSAIFPQHVFTTHGVTL